MPELYSEQVSCPYCGERFEAIIDTSNPDYIEDCAICCRPITFTLRESQEGSFLQLNTEDDC
jgi:cysteine-rich CPXCG protein